MGSRWATRRPVVGVQDDMNFSHDTLHGSTAECLMQPRQERVHKGCGKCARKSRAQGFHFFSSRLWKASLSHLLTAVLECKARFTPAFEDGMLVPKGLSVVSQESLVFKGAALPFLLLESDEESVAADGNDVE